MSIVYLYNIEAERSLLGALILNNTSYEKVRGFLKEYHFHNRIHTHIFSIFIDFYEKGKIADPITLRDYFNDCEALKSVGGAQYLIDLAAGVISIAPVAEYGKIIYELYLKRRLVSFGGDLVQIARTPELKMQIIIQEIIIVECKIKEIRVELERLYTTYKPCNLPTQGEGSKGFMNFSDALKTAIKNTSE